jgi:RNA polymerase sigma factor (sigma-70 family)
VSTARLSDFFRRLTRGMAAQTLGDHSDRQLVRRALSSRDEAAFQAIVLRHGPMVYRVCWRGLRHAQDAEDAFQATFLVLAQRLRTLRKHASLASWLHGVAHRVALKARARAAAERRRQHEASLPESTPPDDLPWREVRAALDGELNRLPEKWRLPLILCYLQGCTQDESADALGWSKSTLRRRLDEARDALGRRLKARGIALPAALSAVLVSDCVTGAAPGAALVSATIEAAARVAAGKSLTAAASATVAGLAEGVLNTMLVTKVKLMTTALMVAVGIVALGSGSYTHHAGAQTGSDGLGLRVGKKEPPGAPKGAQDTTIRIAGGARLYIQASNTLPDNPIKGVYQVEPSGKVALGPAYGRVQVTGLTPEEAEVKIRDHLSAVIREPQVLVTWYDPVAHGPRPAPANERPRNADPDTGTSGPDANAPRNDKLDTLLKKRLTLLRQVAENTRKQYQSGLASPGELLRTQDEVFKAELELAGSNKERLAVLEKRLAVTKELEALTVAAYKAGVGSQVAVWSAEISRVEAEIALERAKAGVNKPASSR